VVKITKAQTLYAHWVVGSYAVSFDPQGGAVSPLSKTVKFNAKYGTLPTPVLDGSTFVGWFTDATDGTLVTASTVAKIGDDQTLYAHWE